MDAKNLGYVPLINVSDIKLILFQIGDENISSDGAYMAICEDLVRAMYTPRDVEQIPLPA